MNILMIHKVPYSFLPVGEVVDHDKNQITYVGVESAIATLPNELQCRKIIRPGKGRISDEVMAVLPPGERFDRVVSVSENEMIEAAIIRSRLGAAGATPEEISLVRDKVAMKKALLQHGLRIPKFVAASELTRPPLSAKEYWPGRTVLKPRAGSASVGVQILPDFRSAVEALDSKDVDQFELEEFVEGEILHFDGVMNQGRPLFVMANRYIGTCFGFMQGSPVGSFEIEFNGELCRQIIPYLHALCLNDGAFHLEMIQSPEGLVFLEVGARVGGSYIGHTVKAKVGFDPDYLDLAVKSGLSADGFKLNVDEQSFFGQFCYPAHSYRNAGKWRLEGIDQFKRSPMMMEWDEHQQDQPLTEEVSYLPSEVLLGGVLRDSSSARIEAEIRKLFSTVRVVTQN